MSTAKTVLEIIVRYDDGTEDYAGTDRAEGIWRWLMAGQSMNLIHGGIYSGKQFESRSTTKEEGLKP